MGANTGILDFLKIFVTAKLATSSTKTETHSVTPYELFQELLSRGTTAKSTPSYSMASSLINDRNHLRYLYIDGIISYFNYNKNQEWNGNLVYFDTPNAFQPTAIIKLQFANPYYAENTPSCLFGCKVSVLTLWEPYFGHDTNQLCKVIGVSDRFRSKG